MSSLTELPHPPQGNDASTTPPPASDPNRRELLTYSTPGLSASLANATATSLANPILNMTLGISPVLIGYVLALGNLWNAFADPIMGYISDNTRSRWGRRRPYIAAGGIGAAIAISLLWWMPTSWTPIAICGWYAAGLLLFFSSMTAFGVAYYALGIELSTSYHGRTRVAAYRSVFEKIANIGGQWLFPLCLLPIFPNTMTGVRVVALGVALLLATSTLSTAWSIRERFVTAGSSRARVPFLESVRGTFSNIDFLRIASIYMILILILSVFSTINNYIGIYYVFQGNLKLGATVGAIAGTIGSLVALASIPLITWISHRFGKHRALALALSVMCAGSVAKWFCYTPKMPYLQLIVPFFYALGISAVFTVLASMMADVVDSDELHTGRRNEGLFGACASWLMKSGGALGTAISGWVLVITGFDIKLGGNQSVETFFWMRVCFSLLPAIMCLLALALLYNYPLTEKRMEEIKQEIQRRKNASTSSPNRRTTT